MESKSANVTAFYCPADTNNCEDLIGLAEGLSQESANAPMDYSMHNARLDGACGVGGGRDGSM